MFDISCALRPSLAAPVFGPIVKLSPLDGVPLIVTVTPFMMPGLVALVTPLGLLIVSVAPEPGEYGTASVDALIVYDVDGEPATVTTEPTGKPVRPVPAV